MLVKEFVEYHHSLDIICFTDRFNKYAISLATYSPLPSWVPDWRATAVPWVIPAMACQSSKNHIRNFRPLSERSQNHKEYIADPLLEGAGRTMQLSSDLRTLHCRGILLDYVDGIGGLKVSHRVEHANATWDSIHPTIPSTSPANTNVPPKRSPTPPPNS
ncbi:hypothetical protein B0O99DRAFT_726437 [Bisporella sp. PMI_857]|nr:hypothetical protein B0O99DRAFT_726437 [Bisporella sp. PMI_857]